MKHHHHPAPPSPLAGAVAGGLGAGPQLTLFGTPQTELTSDDYYTPRWIFDAMQITFDIDAASPPDGPPNTPCRKYFTQLDDGLTQHWEGSVFLNPPFTEITPWVNKWLDHKNGVLLVPMSKSKWFDNLWNSNAAILALPYNLKFDDPKGGRGSIFIACVLAALGKPNVQALHRVGRVR
jgi:phage N-6-adenine-methyltransferase